ncbi:MAG: hypothetical protein ACRD47_15870, partial [Nitrososphaeraceae archaeon]
MKINCNVCIRNPSTTIALTLAVGIFLLTSAAAAASTVSPLQQQVFAQQVTEETEPGSVLKLARTNVPIDIP